MSLSLLDVVNTHLISAPGLIDGSSRDNGKHNYAVKGQKKGLSDTLVVILCHENTIVVVKTQHIAQLVCTLHPLATVDNVFGAECSAALLDSWSHESQEALLQLKNSHVIA